METSKVLARIIGPLLIAPALGIFLNVAGYQRLLEEFSKSPALLYLSGLMALLVGLIILEFHHKWEARWPVIITILGWICVIKGVALILFPGFVPHVWYPAMGNSSHFIVSLGISFIVGVFLTVKGYWGRSD